MCYNGAVHGIQLENRSRDLTPPEGSGKTSGKAHCLNWIKNNEELARPREKEENCVQRKKTGAHAWREQTGVHREPQKKIHSLGSFVGEHERKDGPIIRLKQPFMPLWGAWISPRI